MSKSTVPGYFTAATKLANEACYAAYKQANPKPPKSGKTPKQYSVPEWVKPLMDAAHAADEHETKRIMMLVRMGCYSMI